MNTNIFIVCFVFSQLSVLRKKKKNCGKMAEEIDENEFFHEDYTTNSEWELFNHKLNEMFVNDFNLLDTEITKKVNVNLQTCDWDIIKKDICFANTSMAVSFYRARPETTEEPFYSQREISVHDNAFTSNSCDNPISRHFLLTMFVVVEPESECLVESQVRMLQSSALMAMDESGIKNVPVFITDNRRYKNVFFGVSVEDKRRRYFDVIRMGDVPGNLRYLSGVSSVFKNKLNKTLHLDNSVSVQISYALKIGTGATSPLPESSRFLLPYGVSSDPVRQVTLKCNWVNYGDDALMDSVHCSTLIPESAPHWSISVQLETHIKPIYHLSKCMEDYLRLKDNVRSLQSTASNLVDFLNDDNIKLMFTYLFPPSNVNYYENIDEDFNQQYKNFGIKTAPSDSIVTRFSCILATYNNSMGGMNSVGSLWLFFINELSRRFEKCSKIPGILTSTSTPDARTCILHQKLQLLNICIDKKKIEEGKIISDEDSDQEEFYDCPPETEENGRLEQLDDLMLLNHPTEPLYIPITQEPGPKTEDELLNENLSKHIEKALVSDMESFKAANPKGAFEDFIRWHSPKDWIDDDLSPRMKYPGNSWINMWESANTVPAKKQKRLFDFNEEAEKIIDFLKSRTIGEICDLTLSTLLHSILLKLESEGDPALEDRFKKIHEQLSFITNNPENCGNGWREVVEELSAMDSLINNAKKLSARLSQLELEYRDILRLLNGEDVNIVKLKRINFQEQLSENGGLARNTGQPFKKEFVLTADKPSQFMRVILHNGLTLCGSFTEDTNFI